MAESFAKRWSVAVGAASAATLLALALPFTAHAQGPGERMLDAFLASVQTLRADFEQTVEDADQRLLQYATGTLAVRRPDRFRWNYTEPAEQVIVADGERIWMYDAELMQVTVRPLDETLASTPAMLLSGGNTVREHSDFRELGEAGDLYWLGLLPKSRDTEFESVRIGFDRQGGLVVMELMDGFGQTTRIQFRNLVRNPQIDDSVFRFIVPEGVDVIGGEG